MLFIKDTYIDISKRRKKVLIYFVFVAFFLPAVDMSGYSSIFNIIIPNPLGYKFLAVILSLPLLCRPKLSNSNAKFIYQLVLFATSYQISVFAITSYRLGFYDALTIYRHSFVQCLHFAVLIPFITNLRANELRYVLRLMCNLIIALSIIYLLDNFVFHLLSKIALGETAKETRGGVSVDRSIIGFPPVIGGWIFFFFVCALKGNKRARLLLIFSLLVTFMSFTRSMLLEAVIGIAFIVFALVIFKQGRFVGRSMKALLGAIVLLIIINVINPSAIAFWENKLSETFGTELKEKVGTYNFRERLIEDANKAIRGKELMGLGYVRDTEKGEYSMVQGGDTYIAPIIYCEGYIGLLLRILPYFYLSLLSLSRVIRKKGVDAVDFAILALVVSSIAGYVQTKTIACYPLSLMVLMLLKQIQFYNDRGNTPDDYGF